MITLGAPFYRHDGGLFVEDQTISGLRAWAQHFSRVTAASVCLHEKPPAGWSDAAAAGIAEPQIELVELPNGYDRATFAKTRDDVAEQLLSIMRRTTYRLFAIGGWIGDWGVLGADTARKNGIPHGIWFDRVESQVMLESAGSGLVGRVKGRLKWAVGAWNERRVLRGADLALLHGRTVFDRLAPLTRNPHIVEDIHLVEADRISPEALATVREVEKGAKRISLMELTERTCKWPIGDPSTDDFYFCGLPCAVDKPYCAAHVAVAYQPMSSRRDRERNRGRAASA